MLSTSKLLTLIHNNLKFHIYTNTHSYPFSSKMCYLSRVLLLKDVTAGQSHKCSVHLIAHADTQPKVPHVCKPITHILLYFQLKDVPSQLSLAVERCAILTAGYSHKCSVHPRHPRPIAHTDTQQAEVPHICSHTNILFQLKDVPSQLSLAVERCAILTAGQSHKCSVHPRPMLTLTHYKLKYHTYTSSLLTYSFLA